MGLLVEGKWQDKWYDTSASGGRFVRPETRFRDRLSADGSSGFAAEPGRYHLYVAYACPWAHRVLLMRKLKGLEDSIPVSVVHWHMDGEGWRFEPDEDGASIDHVHGFERLHQVYTAADPCYSGRVTVPVLWDIERGTIVNNESAELMRMLNGSFNDAPGTRYPERDFYPEGLRGEIDRLNDEIYHAVNNGVYKAGFATTQAAYEESFIALFATLDRLDARLETRRWLIGENLTEADLRLFTTLVRFDAVYVGHFKCNRQRIADYCNLSGYLRDIYNIEGVRETIIMSHIKKHYYGSHESINPTGVVPLGPTLDLDAPHDRDRLGGGPF